MVNNRDNNHDDDESEYHFSDDEANYEVEAEAPTAVAPEPKPGFFSRFSQSRRLILIIIVFLVLVYIVYKMVSPTTVPSTDITAPSAVPKPMSEAPPSTKQASVTTTQTVT